jgi:hypothetical protein
MADQQPCDPSQHVRRVRGPGLPSNPASSHADPLPWHPGVEVARTGRDARTGGDAGQALPLVAGVVALVVVLALGAVRVGTAVHARARAHTAADAAALAGAAEGRAAADRLAGANGARVTAYRESGSSVEVEVVLDGVRATARAELRW